MNKETAQEKNGAESQLLSAEERAACESLVPGDSLQSRRAHALLTLDEGATHKEAAAQSGLTLGQVKYCLRRFRNNRMLMFPDVDAVEPQDEDVLPAEVVEETTVVAMPAPDAGQEDDLSAVKSEQAQKAEAASKPKKSKKSKKGAKKAKRSNEKRAKKSKKKKKSGKQAKKEKRAKKKKGGKKAKKQKRNKKKDKNSKKRSKKKEKKKK